MTTSQDELPLLATEQEGLLRLRPSTQLRELQEQAPICRVRTPAGDEAWLVTRYAEVKQLLMDERFGAVAPGPGVGAAVRGQPVDGHADHPGPRGRA